MHLLKQTETMQTEVRVYYLNCHIHVPSKHVWRTERRTVVIPMTPQFGCLKLLITRTFLSGPVKFEITRVDCILIKFLF